MTTHPPGSRRRPRALNDEERRLWNSVARSVKPLRRHPPAPEVENSAATRPPRMAKPSTALPTGITEAAHSKKKSTPALAPLERRDKKRLVRGRASIDARIDLHGMTQGEAHVALERFLRRAQADGAKFALVITGKGKRADDRDRSRGVLRRQVPLWLHLPEFRPYVVGFEDAHIAHGGEGALYVRVRRKAARVDAL